VNTDGAPPPALPEVPIATPPSDGSVEPAALEPLPGPRPPEASPVGARVASGAVGPVAQPVPAAPAMPPPLSVQAPPARRLIGVSFDLLSRSSDEMRTASFYIGAILVGTVGGYALASWALEVVNVHHTGAEMRRALGGGLAGWLALLGLVAGLGVIVASVESRAMAAAILGGRFADRPVTVRSALARSRATFWRVIVASIIVAIPLGVAQVVVAVVMAATVPTATELEAAVTVLIAAFFGAPFAYLLTGVVLGDVDPLEATRRSFRVFGARKRAAVLVALFESIAQLLVLFGLSAGLDIAIRVLTTLGLGVYSGPAGIALTSLMIVVGVFALGTLIFTVATISIAPQVVMFVGLTHATMGLDHVRGGGDRDPEVRHPGQRAFRRYTRPMLLGFVAALVGLVGALGALPN